MTDQLIELGITISDRVAVAALSVVVCLCWIERRRIRAKERAWIREQLGDRDEIRAFLAHRRDGGDR
jgi:hypothetical protein